MKKSVALFAISIACISACGSTSTSSSSSAGGSSSSNSGSGSGGNNAAVAAAKANPCTLLTQAQATAAFGSEVDGGTASNDVVPGCLWAAKDGHVVDSLQAQVQDVVVFNGSKQAGSASGFTFESVSGLGEDAFFQIPATAGSDPTTGTLLGVKKNGVAIYIGIHHEGFTLDQVKAAEKTAAQNAIAKLG